MAGRFSVAVVCIRRTQFNGNNEIGRDLLQPSPAADPVCLTWGQQLPETKVARLAFHPHL